MTRSIPLILPLAGVLALLAASPAAAQDDEERGWRLRIGPGIGVAPKYPGADNYGFTFFPIVGVSREGARLPYDAPDDSLGFGLLGGDSGFDLGPALRIQRKRREEDVGAPVGDVGTTVEAGGFVEAFLGDNFRLRAEGRQGIGGHGGLVGDLSADFFVGNRENVVFSIGPRARWADSDYHDAFYGVPPAVAVASGIPTFDPGSGFHAIGAATGLTVMLNERWGFNAYAGYDRLIGDAADSPIVTRFGSRSQFSGGIGVFYAFNIGD